MIRQKIVLAVMALVFSFVQFCQAAEDDWLRPLGAPPKAKPKRLSGGESFPPLPLPATPLRRSERKREPSAPKLIGKVIWGEVASFTDDAGTATQVADWNMCPNDIKEVLRKAGSFLGTPYSAENMPLSNFHGDPQMTPVLFFSGGRTLRLDKGQLSTLRSYILSGGMAVFDSIAGSPYFYDSCKERLRECLPEYSVRIIPKDHPLYHIVYDIDKVKYPQNLASDEPFLEGVYVGSRIGALISRYGLGCGWDNRAVPLIKQAVYYDVPSANMIGVNLISYAVGYNNVGLSESKPELFGALDEKRPTDEFVFAQIKHEGAWNVHPTASSALLRRLRQNSALKVSLKRVAVSPDRDSLNDFSFLYLTGLDDFVFDDKAVSALRAFLSRGGTLFINNGLGMKTFDAAVRRELSKIATGATLEPIPATHPLFIIAEDSRSVPYTPALAKTRPGSDTPVLEGISIGGDLRIIYSPYDLESGWESVEHPLCKGYEPAGALKLGRNILLYAMTH